MKGGEFLGQLSDYHLPKKVCSMKLDVVYREYSGLNFKLRCSGYCCLRFSQISGVRLCPDHPHDFTHFGLRTYCPFRLSCQFPFGGIYNSTDKVNDEKLLTDASKEIVLEVNAEKTKYMLLSRHQNSGQNRGIKIANRSFENLAKLKYFGRTV
jgi:hypothetical protein